MWRASTPAQRLTVIGKRNKTRAIPIEDPGALGALADWLHLRGADDGALFTRIDRVAGGQYTVTHDRLTDQAIYYILDERRQQAGVEPFTPHDLRRTFAGDLLDAGADMVTAQKLMGHSSAQTTAGYDRRGEETKRKAVRALGCSTPAATATAKGVHHDQAGVLGAAPGAGAGAREGGSAGGAALHPIRGAAPGCQQDGDRRSAGRFPLDAGSGHRYADYVAENYERFRLALLRLPAPAAARPGRRRGLARRLPGQPSAVDRRADPHAAHPAPGAEGAAHDDWRPGPASAPR